jgi:hypothetical protein
MHGTDHNADDTGGHELHEGLSADHCVWC